MDDTVIIVLALVALGAVYFITKPKPQKETNFWDVIVGGEKAGATVLPFLL